MGAGMAADAERNDVLVVNVHGGCFRAQRWLQEPWLFDLATDARWLTGIWHLCPEHGCAAALKRQVATGAAGELLSTWQLMPGA